MQIRYVYIDDISKIDHTKATVYDLNKRYIDSEGNMYGLRYNRESKKIDVIRLVRTSVQHAQIIAKRMHANLLSKKSSSESVRSSEPSIIEEFTVEEDDSGQEPIEKPKIIPDAFIAERFNELPLFRERIKGILRNINSSNINTRDHREITNPLDEVLRNIEIDGLGKIDKVTSLYRELSEYPRSINYYIGRLDPRSRNVLNAIHSDAKKIKFILWADMKNSLHDFYSSLDGMLRSLSKNINALSDERLPKLSANERQLLTDSTTTVTNTINEIREIDRKLDEFDIFIHNIENSA